MLIKKPKSKNKPKHKYLQLQNFLTLFLITTLIVVCFLWFFQKSQAINYSNFLNGFVIGIIAQTIDGAIGMAYGITATTFMLSQGISPAIASSSVHISEIFTTGASGLSHWRLNNIDKKLFLNLVFPGIVGGLIGVLILTNIDGKILKPWISLYLVIMGIFIILKAFKKNIFNSKTNSKKITPLAFVGGMVDAVGGGGWGPVVTTTLLSSGHEPKKTIGSVNSAEFFITISTGLSLTIFVGVGNPEIIFGLISGGVLIAPLAAKITTKLPTKLLMLIVGILITFLSMITVIKFFF
jgi:uncharacterized membrane protein YfcA